MSTTTNVHAPTDRRIAEEEDRMRRQLAAYRERGLKLCTSSSFQTHSIPLLHLLHRFAPDTPVYFLDTGFHFPETLTFRDRVAALLDSEVPAGTWNAVEHTASVAELAALTGELVPGLEVLTVNQHLRMRSLDVQTPCPLFEHLPLPDVPLRQELRNFLERFAF